ncbi:MAG: molybdopterin-dependent oxidoreductase [Chloroflexi bacterium]|nr:molybdopterin-dependent oxidoreductase [Chloroflexota bacterium]
MGPKLTRRQFVKASGATVATVALSKYLFDWSFPSLLVRADSTTTLDEKWVPTTCWIGKQDCGILAHIVDGRIVKFEGHPDHPRNRGRLCPKGQAQILSIYDPYRIKAPLLRTNPKGQPGEWREISWDEALTLVGEKIKEVRTRDKRLLIWQKGRSKGEKFYDSAFVNASGATKLHHGAYCSDAGYRAMEYTVGLNGVLHPDFRHCNYLLSWGWNMTGAGGNKLCFITYPRQFMEARDRGMKVVALDPRRRGIGPHADRWLAIRPGTDLAFFLALASVLISRGYIDREYLTKYTNSPFLVKDDGYFLRVGGKELIWDTTTGSAVAHDSPRIAPALEGEYTVDGAKVKTAFQVYKEHVAKYTPEWASQICDVPAEELRQIGEELGENARIGNTIVLDGVELAYRPVGMMAYHITQQELGFQAARAAVMVYMLLGAIEAVGGVRIDFKRGVADNFKGLDSIEIKDPPYNIYLKDSKYFPINSNSSSIVAQVMLNPAKYGVNYTPEVLILHMSNPLLSYPPQNTFIDSYKKFKFVAAIDPNMNETSDYFADVILPASTIEKYEGPFGVTDQYEDAETLRIPPIPPLYQSRGDIDIYIDLCEKAEILYGQGGYLDQLNSELKLKDTYKLDLNTKPTVRDIFDRWAKSAGYDEGIAFFEKGSLKKSLIPVDKLYASVSARTSGGIRHRLYGESLKRYRDVMKDKGAGEIYWQDYTAFPTWRNPTMNQSPREYDLYLFSHKKIEFKQSRSTFNALLNELEPEQRLEMNHETARARGIQHNDEVWVESHNAVTGETKRLKAKVRLIESIRPDSVAMSHHYGSWVHPVAKGNGPTPNSIFYSGEGYVANTADQSFHVKVKVSKV